MVMKIKKLGIMLILSFLITMICLGSLSGEGVVHVIDDSNYSNYFDDNGNIKSDSGINDGDTLKIGDIHGTPDHLKMFIINKHLTITSNSPSNRIIEGRFIFGAGSQGSNLNNINLTSTGSISGPHGLIYITSTDHISLENNYVFFDPKGYGNGYAIEVSNSNDIILKSNIIMRTGGSTCLLMGYEAKNENISVIGNYISSTENGGNVVHAKGENYNITGNNIVGSPSMICYGIKSEASNLIIDANNISGSSVGITGAISSNDIISNNNIFNIAGDGYAGGYGISMGSGSVINSTFTNIDGRGISMGSGSVINSTFTNTGNKDDGGAIRITGNGNVTGSNFTNTKGRDGGAIYFGSGGSVRNSTFTNTYSKNNGGAIYFNNKDSNSNVTACNFIGCNASNGGAIYSVAGIIINFNRFINNSGKSNGVTIENDRVNCNYNWWGNNTPQSITNADMSSYYQVQLRAGDTINTNYNGSVPIDDDYRLVLNGTNDSNNAPNLPYFNKNISLKNSNSNPYGVNLFNRVNLFNEANLLRAIDDNDARQDWSSTINDLGNYTLRSVVDNEDVNISISAEGNTNTNTTLTLNNISDTTINTPVNINGKLTNLTGDGITGKTINITVTLPDGSTKNLNNATDADGNYIYLYIPLNNGKYIVDVKFFDNYNLDSSNSTSFNVKENTNTNLRLNNIPDTTVNNSVNISGKLTNLTGDGITGKIINITVTLPDGSNVNLNNVTDADGNYTYLYTPLTNGKYIVDANFFGDGDNYEPSSNSTSFKVENKDSNGNPTGGGNIDGDGNNLYSNGNNGLANTGFPLIILLVLSVLGVLYWRRR
jgi:hypothetical protein